MNKSDGQSLVSRTVRRTSRTFTLKSISPSRRWSKRRAGGTDGRLCTIGPWANIAVLFLHLLLPSMITDSLLFASFPLFTLPTFLSPDLPPKTVSKIDPLLPCSTVPVRQHPPAIHTLVPYDFREVDLASFCNPSSLKVDLFPGKDAVCTRTSFLRSLFCSQLRDHILPSAHSCRRTQRKNIFKEKKKACDTRALKGLLGQYSFLVCCPLPNNPLLH